VVDITDKNDYDNKTRYCRLLGHSVPFRYCRQASSPLFCRHIIGCWSDFFEVSAYLHEHFSEEQIRKALQPPPPKMVALLDLIEKAQQKTQQDESE
jgi:hypothetical protein